jgi:monoamine oxidase
LKGRKYKTNAKIIAIKEGQQLEITDSSGNHLADKVITTLPPNLLIKSVAFEPNLPEALHLAKKNFMDESIKFAVEYATPF